MTPIKFDGFNAIYRAPLDWDEASNGPCADLPVQRVDGLVKSRWWPSKDDIDILLAGGAVEISLAGGQPAMAVRAV